MAAIPNYDYSRTTVSDAHRVMFHSFNRMYREYDPEYFAAAKRLDDAQRRRSADYEDAFREGRPFESDTPGPRILPFRGHIDPNAKEVPRDAD
jgi:hypothetical protein